MLKSSLHITTLFGSSLKNTCPISVISSRSLCRDQRSLKPPTNTVNKCDVLIIGGGAVGSSTAFWLKRNTRQNLSVVVVEKDNSYAKASTVLSVGGVRQQFSLPENVKMSVFGAHFIEKAREYLGDVELNFTPNGYLILASETGAQILRENSAMQNKLGARNEVLTPDRLKRKFPWISTDGIALGCYGLEKEGWFDPWAFLMGFKNKAREYGAQFVDGEVIGFEFDSHSNPNGVMLRSSRGEEATIKFSTCVIAAGAMSGNVAQLAGIGKGKGHLSVALPVEPRKRYVYVFDCQGENCPGLNTPLTIDPNGTYFRRDGLCGNYIGGRSPDNDNEPAVDNLEVDHEFFDTDVWPTLAKRVPAFESIRVHSSWAGFYEHNTFDENGIIGVHPFHSNVYIATGFSGHGIQQSPAVGRAISELIIDGKFTTIDLTRLGFDRVINQQPMLEALIV